MNNFDKEYFLNSRKVPTSFDNNVDSSLFTSVMEEINEDSEKKKGMNEYFEGLEDFKNESPYESLERQVAGHTARAFEGLSGFYGDMQEFISTLTGLDAFPEKEIPTKEQLSGFRFPSPESMEGPNFSNKLVTSPELREQSRETFGEYLEPKGEGEKATQEIAQDIGSIFALPGNLSWAEKLILPVMGQSAKQIVKKTGGTEKQQDIAKLGAMTLSSLFRLGNAHRVASNALTEAENMIPQGLTFSSVPTQTAFQRIQNSNWYRSGPTLAKRPAIAEMERIEPFIQSGQIEGRMAIQLRRDINEARRNMGGFNIVTKPDKAQALRHLNEVDNALRESMAVYGNNVNPDWWRQYNLANEAFGVTRRSQALSEFIHDNAGRKLISDTGKYLFGAAVTAGASTYPVLTSGAVTGYGAMKSFQIANRVMRSELLRHHYMDVVRRASLGNAKQTKDAVDKFDRVAKKLEDQSKKSSRKNEPIM